MAKTDKRWQLLLVADDGQIVPFKRIKGVVVGAIVLLVLLGLVCAGLAWQWTAETVRHRRTQERLAAAERQATHFKREHELIAAELVLAEARMEKAGMPVPRRRDRVPPPTTPPSTHGRVDAPSVDDGAAPPAIAESDRAPDAAVPPPAVPETKVEAVAAAPETSSAVSSTKVSLGNFEVAHDTAKKVLRARFRVINDGPPSSPITGHCVVVLKKASVDPDQWQAMPEMRLTDGTPDGKTGQAFRIANFIDMEILRPVQGDPSIFATATVHVFDPSGATLLTRDFPIDLPAPAAQAATPASPPPTAEIASAGGPQGPLVDVDDLKVVVDEDSPALVARFRVRKSDFAGATVAGRCVVVLHDPLMDPAAWLTMPTVELVDGMPDGTRGHAFRIARFKTMEIKVMGPTDPSRFSVASVHVFAGDGTRLLQKDFPVDLPAPEAKSESATAQEVLPTEAPPSIPTTADPSLDDTEPATKTDSRARF